MSFSAKTLAYHPSPSFSSQSAIFSAGCPRAFSAPVVVHIILWGSEGVQVGLGFSELRKVAEV